MKNLKLALGVGLFPCSTLSLLEIKSSVSSLLTRLPIFNTIEDLASWRQGLESEIADVEEKSNSDSNFTPPESTVSRAVSGFFSDAKRGLSCEACKTAIKTSARLARLSVTKKPVMKTFEKLCQDTAKQPKSVCEGITGSLGPVLFKVLQSIDTKDPVVPAMACYGFGGICPMPDLELKQIDLPPLKEYRPKVKRSGKHKFVMHITDLHYDSEYREGAEVKCNKPVCCQKDSNSDMDSSTIIQPAKKWGEYTCDINGLLLDSMMKHAAKVHKRDKFDMVLFTGDLPAHDMWKEEREITSKEESEGLRFIDRNILPNSTRLYPAVGNHEVVPVNLFPLDGNLGSKDYYLYDFLAKEWQTWIPAPALKSLAKGGFFSTMHNPNLKIISLNNNLYYSVNFYNLLEPTNPDPNGMLKWLVSELQDAEERGIRVYIASHIPPGTKDFYPHWSSSYYRIIQRYSHLITGQFYGHEHWDEIEMFYSGETKSKDTAINTGYLTPSISTFGGTNPGYRVYKVDSNTYEVVDYIQYYADLSQQDQWEQDAEWKVLYTARSVYGKGMSLKEYPTLSPAFWHQVTENLASDTDLFNTFYSLRNKNGTQLPTCDETCREEFVCTLRAGKSGDNCASANPFG